MVNRDVVTAKLARIDSGTGQRFTVLSFSGAGPGQSGALELAVLSGMPQSRTGEESQRQRSLAQPLRSLSHRRRSELGACAPWHSSCAR